MANVTFHIGDAAPGRSGLTTGGLYINKTGGGVYYATSATAKAEVASKVSFTRSLTSGTKVGTITINGNGTDLYSTDTLNTAGGTDSIETLYLVGMKSHGETSAQTYSQGTCYTLGGHLYSNNKKCCGYSSKIVYGDHEAPNSNGETGTSTVTVSAEDLGGILVGYNFSGCSLDSLYQYTLCGVTVGVTTTGRGPSYKIGVKLTRTGSTVTIRENYPMFTVYYIPFA